MKKIEIQNIYFKNNTARGNGGMASNDFNKRIVDSAPISILTIDKNGLITFVNKNFGGLSPLKNPICKNIFELPFFKRENLVPLYKKVLSDGISFKKENLQTKNTAGDEKYISIVAVPLMNENGEIDGALSMATDVTDAVMARMEVDRLNQNLKERVLQKTHELQEANERLKKSLALKSQFISDASHELRTPLSVAKLNLEFFKKQHPKTDNASCIACISNLGAVDEEISRVADILSDITFFTSIDNESVEKMHLVKIDLNKFLENIAGRIKSLADKKDIKIILTKDKIMPVVTGDAIKLERLFLNIISNAVKYGRKSGWIKIKVGEDTKNKSIKIAISDNGVGILKSDMPRIFDRFYRTSLKESGGEGGFGLGLAISKWVVDQHKGSIKVASAEGEGSVFTITLPINARRGNSEVSV